MQVARLGRQPLDVLLGMPVSDYLDYSARLVVHMNREHAAVEARIDEIKAKAARRE